MRYQITQCFILSPLIRMLVQVSRKIKDPRRVSIVTNGTNIYWKGARPPQTIVKRVSAPALSTDCSEDIQIATGARPSRPRIAGGIWAFRGPRPRGCAHRTLHICGKWRTGYPTRRRTGAASQSILGNSGPGPTRQSPR